LAIVFSPQPPLSNRRFNSFSNSYDQLQKSAA